MKRFVLMAGVMALAVAAFCTAAAAGGRTYDNRDLTGTYYLSFTQVHLVYPPGGTERVVEYCSGYGTATFDGVSTMTVDHTNRCSVSGTTTGTESSTYVMQSDGTFLVNDSLHPPDATHCRVVDHGRMFLCDGSLPGSASLSFQVVAVKE